jgi:hypothetical protein
MRKVGGLAGVGEGEREGTPRQQNSIDQSFKTVFCRSSNKIKTISVLKQYSVGLPTKLRLSEL